MRRWAALMATVALLSLVVSGSVAGAAVRASGYPPTTTTTLVPPTFASSFATTILGNEFTTEACGFMPDTTATFTYNNGTETGTFNVDKAGCIEIVIQTFDPHVTINGGPLEPAAYKGNTIVVVGTGANTAQRTYTLTFDIIQPSSTPSNNVAGSSSSGSAGSSSSGSLAFTGSNALATGVGGLALLVAGTFLVLTTRRYGQRRQAQRRAAG